MIVFVCLASEYEERLGEEDGGVECAWHRAFDYDATSIG
jgi:hypothetical protein